MNVYFISGLGADRQAFEKIHLPGQYAIRHLDWIKHKKRESLSDYAKRLAASIDTTKPFALVGLSMGGMIATAMTQFLSPCKTILISSLGCTREFPPLFKTARLLQVHRLRHREEQLQDPQNALGEHNQVTLSVVRPHPG